MSFGCARAEARRDFKSRGPVFTIFYHSFQVRGVETMCIPPMTVFMRSVLKFESMWFGFGVVCAVI